MYNELDSRALGRADCYGQRFMRPGDYAYAVVPGHAQAIGTDFPHVIHVREDKAAGEMQTHHLRVQPQARGFAVAPGTLTIGVGDMVLWNGGGTVPFAVVGDQEFFNSHRMVNECGYSHAFGKAGDYHWRDAFGSGIEGMVHVRDPECGDEKALRRWREQLAEGQLVMIADGKVDRPKLEIMTGQTVFFAMVKTPGISITDVRLLEKHFHFDRCAAA
ncbi:cupredoxin domain-containing protein [Sphingomonas sp. RS6]